MRLVRSAAGRAAAGLMTVAAVAALGAGSTALGQDEAPPPPLPELGAPPAAPSPAESKGPPTALDRYQECFQKMIDAGASDNAFMKKCLGLASKEKKPRKTPSPKLDAAKTAKAGTPGVRDCYQKLLAETKDLGVTPEGTLEPTVVVKPDGSVASVAFETTAMTDVKLLACVRDKLKAWNFPKSTGTEPVSVQLVWRLTAKPPRTAAAGLAPGFPKVAAAPAAAKPEMPPVDVLAVFKKNAPKLRRCYDDQVKRRPGVAGKVGAGLEVDAEGKAQNVALRDLGAADDAFDDTFRDCLVKELKRWRYPKPAGPAPVPVAFPPLVFSPKGPAKAP